MAGGSIVGNVVRELILVAGMAREMFCKQFPGAGDSVKNAAPLKLPLRKWVEISWATSLPESIPTHCAWSGGVADDLGKFPHARRDEYKNAVSFLRLVHSQMRECLLRGSDRVFGFLAADEDSNLAACFRLRFANRFDDGVVLKLA